MTSLYRQPRLCLFVRAPEQGQVKTRLASGIGAAAALQAYKRLVDHALDQLQPDDQVLRELWTAGDEQHALLQSWSQRWHARLQPQPEGDLGMRMYQAVYGTGEQISSSVQGAPQTAVVVGADCPSVSTKLIEEAFAVLAAGADVAIAPAEDGGYGLVAVAYEAVPPLSETIFSGIDWGTDQVFAQTSARCLQLGLRLESLATVWDVDWPEDWQRFLKTYGDR